MRHSSDAGALATRGQSISEQSTFSMPARVNSSSPLSQVPEVVFITSRAAYSTMFTQKTPVSRMFSVLSLPNSRSPFDEVEANITCGGT